MIQWYENCFYYFKINYYCVEKRMYYIFYVYKGIRFKAKVKEKNMTKSLKSTETKSLMLEEKYG